MDLKNIRKSLENNRKLLSKRLNNTSDKSINLPPIIRTQSYSDQGHEFKKHKRLLRARAESQIDQVEDALKRLESGDYGKCANCGKPINQARLEVIPSATLCINCKHGED